MKILSPSKKSGQRLKTRVGDLLVPSNLAPWSEVRDELNRSLRGWSNYFDYGSRSKAYRSVDQYVIERVRRFPARRHKVQGRGNPTPAKVDSYCPFDAKVVQGTVCKILGQGNQAAQVRHYLERGDAEFEQKMAEVLCVYREIQALKKAAKSQPCRPVAIVSYDEKPGIQAIATTAPDLPPDPGIHAAFARDHEYKRHGRSACWLGLIC